MKVMTYLNFNGDCRQAFEMYERVLGGKITFMMTNGESPMADKTPPEAKDRIMHASLEIPGGGAILGADHPEGKQVQPTGFCVCAHVKEKSEGERVFKGLSEGGKIQMEFEKTFFSSGFGMCIDKFGVPWMVNTETPMG
ncbi:MAG: VOC family protein [Acidobacteriaceae bacterium]